MLFFIYVLYMYVSHAQVKRNTGFTRPGVGSIGLSGMVLTDGTIVHFTPEFIEDIAVIGESGIVTKSGKNVQLTQDLHRVCIYRLYICRLSHLFLCVRHSILWARHQKLTEVLRYSTDLLYVYFNHSICVQSAKKGSSPCLR